MNRKFRFLDYLLEYVFVISIFIMGASVTTLLMYKSYRLNDLANRKKVAIEFASSYIENGDYQISSFTVDESMNKSDDGVYLIDVYNSDNGYKHLEISVSYKGEVLITLPFGGDRHE